MKKLKRWEGREIEFSFCRKAFEDSVVGFLENKGVKVQRIPCDVLPHQELLEIYSGSNLQVTQGDEVEVIHCCPASSKTGKVGVKHVKRLASERSKFPDGTKFSIISSTIFTKPAEDLAEAYGIKLIKRDEADSIGEESGEKP